MFKLKNFWEKYKVYILIFGVALLARIALLVTLLILYGQDTLVTGDTKRYLALADSVVDGFGYVYKGFLETYRAPGYPGYLMPFVFLGLPLWLASVLQIGIASLIPVFVYKFVKQDLQINSKLAWVAVFLAIFEPVQMYYSVMLLPCTFFGVLFLIGVIYLVKWINNQSYRSIIFSALALGIANYFRPAGLYIPVFIGVFALGYLFYKKSISKSAFKQVAVFVIISIFTMVPWSLRNYFIYDNFSFVSSTAYNSLVYAAASSKSVEEGRDYNQVRLDLLAEVKANAPVPANPYDLRNEKYILDKSKAIVAKYPVGFIKSYLLGLNTFLFSGNYHYMLLRHGVISMPQKGLSFSLIIAGQGVDKAFKTLVSYAGSPYVMLAVLGKVFWILMVFGSLVGAYFRRREPIAWVFVACMLYFSLTILSVTIGVEARHRYMLNPLIFSFFVVTLIQVKDLYSRLKLRIRSK